MNNAQLKMFARKSSWQNAKW